MAIRIPTPLIAGTKSHDLHDDEAKAEAEEGGRRKEAVLVAVAVWQALQAVSPATGIAFQLGTAARQG